MLTGLMDFMCPLVPTFSQGQITLEEAGRVRTKKKKEFVTFTSSGDNVFDLNVFQNKLKLGLLNY